LVAGWSLPLVQTQTARAEGEVTPCLCHGPDYEHEWRSESWCCGEEPEEADADVEPIDWYNMEESRYLDKQNARDINKRRE
jgi:hypothetical protein